MSVPTFMQKYMKEAKASLAADEVNSGVVKEWIDSGCYMFNALLSADIYKGFAANKITCIAGEKSTGKCVHGDTLYTFHITDELYEKYKELFDEYCE